MLNIDKKGTAVREKTNYSILWNSLQLERSIWFKRCCFLVYKEERGPAMENTNTILKLDREVVKGTIEALKEENERLRKEINYFQKIKALVQKKKKLQGNKERKSLLN